MKLLTLIPSLFSLILGFYLFNKPLSAIASIGWLIALMIFVWGVQSLLTYFRSDSSQRTVWQLLQAIVTIIFGFILLGSSAFSLSRLVITIIAYWILVVGILRLISSYQLRRSGFTKRTFLSGWGLLLLGILLLASPIFTSVFIGKFLSLILLVIGFSGTIASLRL
ncbi:DUF308 domain-containing protein [Streptococcus halotolerans]|uniref:DUF308 domain-containing protein n=1 Tax=Streptococcus halotolerans TaxID=1814128 RepID=UPI0007881801|nr:DUF308 domain-containing protein [Streptococcus halotolerans]